MSGEQIELRFGRALATISPLGAELRAWTVGDHPLLWPGDPASWPETAPILFPIVGWARDGRIRVGAETFAMPVHGFARELPFAVVERGPARVQLAACATAATRRRYPFDWRLDVAYALAETSLTVELTVRNGGERPMPYACGLHPGFRWPFAGGAPDEYRIEFERDEVGRVPVIAPGGLFSAETRPVPLDGARLPLSPALMAAEALCFLDARSRRLRFLRDGGAAIAMRLDGFPHIALWSRPPAAFLCLEAWTGHGDPLGFAGELAAKPSQRLLEPGGAARHQARFSFSPP